MISYLFMVLMVGHIGHLKGKGYMCQAKSYKKEEEANYKYNPNGKVSNLSQAIGYWL